MRVLQSTGSKVVLRLSKKVKKFNFRLQKLINEK